QNTAVAATPQAAVTIAQSSSTAAPRAQTWTLELQARIERIPQAVAKQIDPQYGDENGEARKRREPPRSRDVDAAVGQHATPRRRRRLDAEPEERQRRLDHDHARHVERRNHEPRRERVRKNVAHQDAPVAASERVGGLDELALS